ncbi:MAG: ADP-ribosylglycohydrolase family protein [Candidatus Methylumidiphilus sp.]
MSLELENRYTGALLGLAIGDAVGTTLEFSPPGSFRPLTDMVGGGPFRLRAGQWTDDTSMALCLAESLVLCQGFDPEDQMRRYVAWWQDGHLSSTGHCFDIGATTRNALAQWQRSGDPFSGSTDLRSAGNGSLMRLAPVAMFYAADLTVAMRMAGESSRTTHAALTCIDACRYFAALLVLALSGESKEALLDAACADLAEPPLCPEIAEIAAGSFKRRNPPEIRGSGYVVRSLEAALWAFHYTESYREAVLRAANLGDDADTTAAICGQLAGAFYGRSGIPPHWLERLAMRELIAGLALDLRRAVA